MTELYSDQARYWGVLNRFREVSGRRGEHKRDDGSCLYAVSVIAFALMVGLVLASLVLCDQDESAAVCVVILIGGLVTTASLLLSGATRRVRTGRLTEAYQKRVPLVHPRWEEALAGFGETRPWQEWSSPYRASPAIGAQSPENDLQLAFSTRTPTAIRERILNETALPHHVPACRFLTTHWPARAPRALLTQLSKYTREWRGNLYVSSTRFPFLVSVVDADTLGGPALMVLVASALDPSSAPRPEETAPGRSLTEEGFVVGYNRAGAYAFYGLEPTVNHTQPLELEGATTIQRVVERVVQMARLGPEGARVPAPVVPDDASGESGDSEGSERTSEAILGMLRDGDPVGVLGRLDLEEFEGVFEPSVDDLGLLGEEAFRPVRWERELVVAEWSVYRVMVADGTCYRYEFEAAFNSACHIIIREEKGKRQVYEFGKSHQSD